MVQTALSIRGRRLAIVALLPAMAACTAAIATSSASAASPAANIRDHYVTGKSANLPAALDTRSPIKHVVVIFNENHSFDNVLSRVCAHAARSGRMPCDGATTGKLSNGTTISLADMPDNIPEVGHSVGGQRTAMHNGNMDQFDKLQGCGSSTGYICYSRVTDAEVPNLTQLANKYGVSDRTFSLTPMASFAQHINIAAFTPDGFQGNNPVNPTGHTNISGWGCKSGKVAGWNGAGKLLTVKSCVPNTAGLTPSGKTPVPYRHTIYEDLQEHGHTFAVYGATYPTGGENVWASIGTFNQLVQQTNYHSLAKKNADFYTDISNGVLPDYSLIVPNSPDSQHNGFSMAQGDTTIGKYVQAIMNSPYWRSTAIFVTYDDCGCFYDHVAPPAGSGLGLRMPLVVISPYVKPGYTDSHIASFASIGAFTEHVLGLPSVATDTPDNTAYDYSDMFDFTLSPTVTRGFHQVTITISRQEANSIKNSKNYQDPNGDT